MTRPQKGEIRPGLVLDEVFEAAKYVTKTSGYDVEVGVQFRVSSAGVQLPERFFARAVLRGENGATEAVQHEAGWHFPTSRYKSMEALMLDLLWRLEDYLEYGA